MIIMRDEGFTSVEHCATFVKMHTMHSNFPSDSVGEVYAVVLRTYCAACIGWHFTYFRTVTSTVMGVTKVFLIFNHSLKNHIGIITKTTHILCYMHWPCKYGSYFVAFMFDINT